MSPHFPTPAWQELLTAVIVHNASDLHLTEGVAAYLRVDNELRAFPELCQGKGEIDQLLKDLLSPSQREKYHALSQLDLAFFSPGHGRFRVNLYRQRGSSALAVRRLDENYRSFDALHLPVQLEALTRFPDGLVLVTGPTGSGKSTTLATMLHQINLFRACHIITIEDPIEYIHHNHNSLVHQREVHSDVPSFAAAVTAALREDPDVLLVGEMRDLETMRATLIAAETGHLVFSTLHTNDVPGTISRLVNAFPGDEQILVREQLSRGLRAIVSQRLQTVSGGRGRVPICEILRVTPAVANLIRTGQLHQLTSQMQTGSAEGMLIAEQSLAECVVKGQLTKGEALRLARDESIFEQRLQMTANQPRGFPLLARK
ncbi:MAG: PilT/PilU family type 4a pilus ATPase [Pirellulales bacterium]|nr:PilT/PilU family type 4a pilus ATPase [Pirellulales bacterium]